MSPADRAALAARLRAEAGTLLSSISTRAECGFPVISARAHADDLLAAAAELERPRPRVEWAVKGDGTVEPFVRGERGPMPLYRAIDADDAEYEFAPAYRSAGFDVDEVPRG